MIDPNDPTQQLLDDQPETEEVLAEPEMSPEDEEAEAEELELDSELAAEAEAESESAIEEDEEDAEPVGEEEIQAEGEAGIDFGDPAVLGTVAVAASAAMAADAAVSERDLRRKQMEEERAARQREREERLNRLRSPGSEAPPATTAEPPAPAAAEPADPAADPREERRRRMDEERAARLAERTSRFAPPPSGNGAAAEAPPAETTVPVATGAPARPAREKSGDKDDAKAAKAAEKDAERAAKEAARKEAMEAKKAEAEAKRQAKAAETAERAAARKAAAEEAAAKRAGGGAGSDFSHLRRESPITIGAPTDSKWAEIAKRGATEGAAIVAGFDQMKKGASSAGAAKTTVTTPAAPGPGSSDYQDILDHLQLRTAVHPEYADVIEKFEPRLKAGGELLRCTLVGINASLIDSVHRKLSNIPAFLELVEWRYIAVEPVLVIEENGHKREIHIPVQGETTIGRGAENSIQVSVPFVSKRHLKIKNVSGPLKPPVWKIQDVGSTHGTTVNGSTLRDIQTITPDDHIELGRGYAAVDYPSIRLIYRAVPIGREDLRKMVVDVDLVIAVVEADREFHGQIDMLRSLSEAQQMGGLLVLAVSSSGPITDSMAANIDELRHAARVLKSTEVTRYLAALDEEEIKGDTEWLEPMCEFINRFRQRTHADVLTQRKQITRKEVVAAIRETGQQLRGPLETQLIEAERKLTRVQDELTGAPRNLAAAESLRDDTFKNLKIVLDDDVNFFSDEYRPDSLTYYAKQLVDQLKLDKKGKGKVELTLVEPVSGGPAHRWLVSELSAMANRHFSQLLATITGAQEDPPGLTYLYQRLRQILGGHEKVRDNDLFRDANYIRYGVSDVTRQLQTALSADFTQFQVQTTTKIDNLFVYMITKTRYAFMFYMSMFSIVGIIAGGLSRNKAMIAFVGPLKQTKIAGIELWWFLVVAAVSIIFWFNWVQYRASMQEKIEEEVDKLRDGVKKHYQMVAKKFTEDGKRVIGYHTNSQESKIKQDMSTLGSSRVSDTMVARNNPALDGAKKERDDIQQLLIMIDQERDWSAQAERAYTPSPFAQAAPARRTTTR